MAWHEQVQRVVFYSGTVALLGTTAGLSSNETWEWDGTSWSKRHLVVAGSGRAWSASAYDSGRGALVLFGGNNYRTSLGPLGQAKSNYLGDTVEYVVPDPASWSTIGAGCAGSSGVVTVTGVDKSRPWLGEQAAFTVSNIPPGKSFILGYGSSSASFGNQSLPLLLDPYGATGCTLWASAEVAQGFLSSTVGANTYVQLIPNSRSILGQQLYVQAFLLDNVNPLGLVTSNALCGTTGSRF